METRHKKTIQSLITVAASLLLGLLAGWWAFGGSPAPAEEVQAEEVKAQVWTCSMHPHIRQDHPGECPLCGMDLIPLKDVGGTGEAIDAGAIQLSKEAAALANVQTVMVSRDNPVKELLLYGVIQADERLARSQVAHVSGRIEKLYVNFAGETVRAGQPVATLYSPDLLNAQQELIEAVKMQALQPAFLAAAREKLRQWKLTDPQIAGIEQSGQPSPLTDIVANTGGIVIARKVSQGDYVSQGSVLFELTDLSSVWALFDAYEADLPYLKTGDVVEYTLQSMPGKRFTGRISFIDPLLDKTTRTAKVRVETPNPGLQLKPEMYAQALIQAPLRQHANGIVIPATAVLWTGRRSIVYVKDPYTDQPVFKLREVELGPSLGDAYVVVSGIDEGEEIVVSGAFSVDASAQLAGKRSMMNNIQE
jgi:Cu(I)/Ag(I) efflux system membrane fusion protein